MPGKGRGGPRRGYSWPPATAGNDLATKSGYSSEPRVASLAAELAEKLLGEDGVPDYLRSPVFALSVRSWARCEAQCRLMWDWLQGMSPQEQVTPSSARAVSSPVEIWLKLERAASRARERLGLDPPSMAKLMKDMGIVNREQEDALQRLIDRGRAIGQQRLTVVDGDDQAS